MPKPHRNIALYPISLLYGVITGVRNFLFNKKMLRSVGFETPVISVGNLAVGGTGKTPHTEFILRNLGKKYKLAVVSRGYKRATKGFILADKESSAVKIGDEPYQIYSKFPDVKVAVDEKRVHGIRQLLKLFPDTEAIILDDAFQHRYVKPGLSILLTDFSNLYSDDVMLPYGTLREWKHNSKRADIILVTKCPAGVQKTDFNLISDKLGIKPHQELFFSSFEYRKIYPVFPGFAHAKLIDTETSVLLITGIVKPEPIVGHLQNFTKNIQPYFFPDHHEFTKNELEKIEKEFECLIGNKIIITTEKDAARFKSNAYLSNLLMQNLYALPLEVKILNNEQDIFIQKIENYVRNNSTNS